MKGDFSMPIGGTREKKTMGRSYQKDPLYQYAKAYKESAYNCKNGTILNWSTNKSCN